MTKITSEANQKKLLKEHPLVNVCPNIEVQGFNKLESLLSSSYSRVITKQQLESDLISLSKNPILDVILNAVAISSNNRPLTIELVEGKMNEYYLESEATGFLIPSDNRIVISKNEQSALNKDTFMHEMGHKAMKVIFKNIQANPYKNYEQKEEYLKAIKDVFLNVIEYMKQQYNLPINIDNNDHPYQIGNNIFEIIGGAFNLLMKGDSEEIISLFKNHPEIDINTKNIPYLDGKSFLESAMLNKNFELANELAKAAIYTNQTFLDLLSGLKMAAIDNNIEIFKIAIGMKPELNYAELEACKEALEIAEYMNRVDIVEILEPYVESNDTWYNYFTGFIPSVSVGSENNFQEERDTFKAIETFLGTIRESYAEKHYGSEFAADFIGIITDHSAEEKVLDIFQPMTNYFENVVYEEFLHYQQTSDETTFCALNFEYGYDL